MHPKQLLIIYLTTISLLTLSEIKVGATDSDACSGSKDQSASRRAPEDNAITESAGKLFSDLSTAIDSFAWHDEADGWWSLDKQRVEMKADAIVTIIDPNRFEGSFYTIESALTRLDDIISPAIRNVITAQRKNDLFEERAGSPNWLEIRPALKEDIRRLYRPYLEEFGIEVAHLSIMMR